MIINGERKEIKKMVEEKIRQEFRYNNLNEVQKGIQNYINSLSEFSNKMSRIATENKILHERVDALENELNEFEELKYRFDYSYSEEEMYMERQ